jgi:hypothetical protein
VTEQLTPEQVGLLRSQARAGTAWAIDKLHAAGLCVDPNATKGEGQGTPRVNAAVQSATPNDANAVRGDTPKAVEFLQQWCEATRTYPVTTAIHTDPATGVKGKIESQAFKFGADGAVNWRSVLAWVDARQGKANIYFNVNPRVPVAETKIKANMREVSRAPA